MKRLTTWTMAGLLAFGAANLLAEEQETTEAAATIAPATTESACQPKLLQKREQRQQNLRLQRRDGSGKENRDGVPQMKQLREQRQQNLRLQKRDGSCGKECSQSTR